MSSENIPLLNENQRQSKVPDKFLTKEIVKQSSLDDKRKEEGVKDFVSNYDDILPYLGNIGNWQIIMTVLLGVMAMDGGIIVLLQNFTALEPKAFRCALAECDGPNATYRDLHIYPTSCSNNANFSDHDGTVCWRYLVEINTLTAKNGTINIYGHGP